MNQTHLGYALLFLLLAVLTTSCATFRKSPKYQFVEGIYQTQLGDLPRRQLYVDVKEDSAFNIYSLKNRVADTATQQVIHFPLQTQSPKYTEASFSKSSFDIDLLTVLVKFRPAKASVASQLNASLNASVFLGQRYDYFRMKYSPSPLGLFHRRGIHYGLSYGVFSGFGNTWVTPTTTAGKTQQEYEGIVWQNGVAMIVGVNNFTFGLTVGVDQLLNADRRIWIYQQKPWVGIGVGLNLN